MYLFDDDTSILTGLEASVKKKLAIWNILKYIKIGANFICLSYLRQFYNIHLCLYNNFYRHLFIWYNSSSFFCVYSQWWNLDDLSTHAHTFYRANINRKLKTFLFRMWNNVVQNFIRILNRTYGQFHII